MAESIDVREPLFVGSELRLIPVVELEPGRFRTRALEPPDGTGVQNPAGWDRYWRESLADAGLGHLEPIHPGSWLVPVARLVEPADLARVLQSCVSDLEGARPSDLDEIEPLAGGFVLRDLERELVSPGCCAGLGDLEEWCRTIEGAASEWAMLWIGHPWASVRREGARLWLRLESEYGPPPEQSLISLDPAALLRAIDGAQEEQRALAARLLPVVEEWLSAAAGASALTAAELAPFLAGVTTRPA